MYFKGIYTSVKTSVSVITEGLSIVCKEGINFGKHKIQGTKANSIERYHMLYLYCKQLRVRKETREKSVLDECGD